MTVAVALGIFSSIYASTDHRNALDRAAYRAGADVRVTYGSPAPRTDTLLAPLPGLAASSVAFRDTTSPGSPGAGTTVLGVDPGTFPAVAWWRPDLGASPSADFEPGERISPEWIAYLISSRELEGFQAPGWLSVLRPALVGAYSADNMDYVPRDSYICGVSAGPVDVQRILHYSFISERGLTLHAHAAEALYMFLNARLYLYSQVYFHRTVRRIDLQLREVFRPTLELELGGNPLEHLDRYLGLTEWSLLSDVDRWAHDAGDGRRRELGQAWAEVVARKLKWKLLYQGQAEARDVPTGALAMTREQFARGLRERLPTKLRNIVFEVDVAAQESRAFNPITETADILFYDPLEDRYQQSRVLDIFRRLPVRMALFRIFAHDESHRRELIHAANEVLGLTTG